MSPNFLRSAGLIIILIIGLAISYGVSTVSDDQDTIYQLSTMQNLSAGGYDGYITIEQLKDQGDFGLGTLDRLNGELIVLNGTFYQALANGTIVQAPDYYKIPFIILTNFEADNATILNQTNGSEVQTFLNSSFPSQNIFYAIKIEGNFSYIKARSVPPQTPPYPNLTDALKNETVFEFQGVNGTLIGFWYPNYIGDINNPGFHFHFINQNRTQGGHVLEFQIGEAVVLTDYTPGFYLKIPEKTTF